MNKNEVAIIECPRDAMQGLDYFIPTQRKVEYINLLLKCGFDVLDVGSFVSARSIPQMRDTAEVLSQIDASSSSTKLLSIVANRRGAESAIEFDQISYLGYPFSISETFQKRNTNKSIEESYRLLDDIYSIANTGNKEVVLYLSMAFGNPYGDHWNRELVHYWIDQLYKRFTPSIISLSDTIGCADRETIDVLFKELIPHFESVDFGAHLHVKPNDAERLINSAYNAGCRRFDAALKGFGGCPMAKDDLTGNMPTEKLTSWMMQNNIANNIDIKGFDLAINSVERIFKNN
jgi:hydroxymethylglutaryl-CoA lyase